MTDFNPPSSPSLPSFGTSVVGAEFTWQGLSADGSTVETITARAAGSISFNETLRYTTGRHAQLVQTANSARQMREKLDGMSPTDPDYQERFDALVNERIEIEQASWRAAVDTMLLLVNETDREKLRPYLIKGDPKQVTELRGWLEQNVLAQAQSDAAVSTGVDPTSAPSPENSSPSPASGDVSGSEASPSTD
jgi:hypothetical protein